ncbi:hypothetical protein [Treponema sp.]|uniref:hypothetical protein n=1 Tax=Treponema sp. TaxID=166 RepID=UPI003F02C24F
MKKTLIAVAAAAALTATSAFAEITFGMWNRAILVPVANDGEDFKAGLTQSWGDAPRTAGLGVTGVSEDQTAGFTFEIRDQPGEGKFALGDRSVLWVKPIEQVKLSLGRFDDGDNGFREGSAGFGSWNMLRSSATTDLFFNGDNGIMNGKAGDGFMVEATPVEGFKAMVNVPFIVYGPDKDDDGNNKTHYVSDAYDVYRKTQFGVAYTAADVGTLKVLWQNDPKEDSADKKRNGSLGVAFNLSAVENLNLSVGTKFDFVDKEFDLGENEGAKANLFYIALNAAYKVSDALTVSLAGGFKMYKESDFDPRWGIGAGVDYLITDGLTAIADVRYMSEEKLDGTKLTDDALSFAVGAKKSIGNNASITAAFEGITNGHGFKGIAAGVDDKGKTHDGFMWCVPVVFDLSL